MGDWVKILKCLLFRKYFPFETQQNYLRNRTVLHATRVTDPELGNCGIVIIENKKSTFNTILATKIHRGVR